jgi:FAD synthetase
MPLWPSLNTQSHSNETNSSNSTSSSSIPRPLQGVYIVSRHPFPEVEDFVASSTREYHLDLARYELAMRPGLEAYLKDRKSVKAIFVGTRRTDPHGEFLTHFDATDKDWPQFMRVHPVIDWHYAQIWAVCLSSLTTTSAASLDSCVNWIWKNQLTRSSSFAT